MKNVAVVLLCILLFFLFITFGFAFDIYQIALSPGFITSTIDHIDFSKTASDILQTSETSAELNISRPLQTAIIDNLDSAEPVLKEKINIFVKDIYDYMLGKASARDFKGALADAFMNPDSVNSLLNQIDLPGLVDSVLSDQFTSSNQQDEALHASVILTVSQMESTIKQNTVNSSEAIFNYLLGETQSVNLKTILRQNFINKLSITEIVNNIDINSVAKYLLSDQVDFVLPLGITLNDNEIDQIIAAVEHSIKASLIAAADPMADYIIGNRPDFIITVPVSNALPWVKPIIKQAFLRQLPPDLAGATQAQIDTAFEVYWASAQSDIPTTFSIGSSIFAADLPHTIEDFVNSSQDALTEARNGIEDAATGLAQAYDESRPYLIVARLVFWSLIPLILLVVGAVILIRRSVREVSRDLGITFTTYGGLSLIGVIIFKIACSIPAFIQRSANGDIPDYVWDDIISPITQRLTQPLFIFSIVCLVIGIALLVVFFIYPKRQPPVEPSQIQPQ